MNMVVPPQRGRFGGFVDAFEENMIALILALMTVMTFINVVLRKGFNDSILWGPELVEYLFAWLVLFGMSYCVKITAHLGVDALTARLPQRRQRIAALLAGLVCIAYALLLLKGSWDYWAPFANLPQTEGRWFPLGFDFNTRENGWYETEFVPMPDMLRFLEPWLLYPEDPPFKYVPRAVPYLILPLGAALLLLRFVQATIAVVRGQSNGLIVSHEAEDAVEQAAEKIAREERN